MEKLALKDIFARMVAHKAEQTPTAEPQAKDAAILIVDDSRTIVRALQLILERAGYITYTAVDGIQAISLARRQRPDAILMDVVMPVMNGFEATRVLVNDPQTASIPVIMMSGTEQVSDRVWGTRLGAKGFIAKPFEKDDLLAKLGSVIAMARRARDQAQTSIPTAAEPLPR